MSAANAPLPTGVGRSGSVPAATAARTPLPRRRLLELSQEELSIALGGGSASDALDALLNLGKVRVSDPINAAASGKAAAAGTPLDAEAADVEDEMQPKLLFPELKQEFRLPTELPWRLFKCFTADTECMVKGSQLSGFVKPDGRGTYTWTSSDGEERHNLRHSDLKLLQVTFAKGSMVNVDMAAFSASQQSDEITLAPGSRGGRNYTRRGAAMGAARAAAVLPNQSNYRIAKVLRANTDGSVDLEVAVNTDVLLEDFKHVSVEKDTISNVPNGLVELLDHKVDALIDVPTDYMRRLPEDSFLVLSSRPGPNDVGGAKGQRRIVGTVIGNAPLRIRWDIHPKTWLCADEWPLDESDGTIPVFLVPDPDDMSAAVPVHIQATEFRPAGLKPGLRVALRTPSSVERVFVSGTIIATPSHADALRVRVDNRAEVTDYVGTSLLNVDATRIRLQHWRRDPAAASAGDKAKPSAVLLPTICAPKGMNILVIDRQMRLREATVVSSPENVLDGSTHTVEFCDDNRPFTLDLNAFNFTSASLSPLDFCNSAASYCRFILQHRAKVEDAITGMMLSIEKQLVLIGVKGHSGQMDSQFRNAENAQQLASMLVARQSGDLSTGSFAMAPILVRAAPGTGKSWSVLQLQYFIAKYLLARNEAAARLASRSDKNTPVENLVLGATRPDAQPEPVPMIPFVVLVQRLAPMVHERSSPPARGSLSLIVEYIRKYEAEFASMLEMALKMRSLVLLIDGLDEAAGLREEIEDYVVNTLSVAGFPLVVTSRPEGVRLSHFAAYRQHFVVLDLKPLSDAQQLMCAKQQLSGRTEGELVGHLIAFSNIRRQHDTMFQALFQGPTMRIANYGSPDHFLMQNGLGWDPQRRQHVVGGSRLIGYTSAGAVPQSNFLLTIQQRIFPEKVLRKLDLVYSEFEGRDVAHEQLAAAIESATNAKKKSVVKLWQAAMNPEQELLRKWANVANEYQVNDAPSPSWVRIVAAQADQGSALSDTLDKVAKTLPLKLLNLARRWQRIPSELWTQCVCETDEIYQVTDTISTSLLHGILHQIVRRAQVMGLCEVQVPSVPKDPVRLIEKAYDDYFTRFSDSDKVPPTACVFDVLRARVVTVDAQSLLALLDLLRGGTLELELEALPGSGQPGTVKRVVLNLVRLKNKFAPSHMDPTHFRNVICNIELEYGQSRVMFELQFHHRDILEYNTVSHAHAHYEYFRSQLGECYASGLDEMLESVLDFFDVVQGVPVIFSILILALSHRRPSEPIPSTVGKLYAAAIEAVFRSRSEISDVDHAAKMYRRVATHLMLEGDSSRVFSFSDVKNALQSSSTDVDMWKQLQTSEHGLPLIRTLAVGDDKGTGDEVQFKHLSFQEGLFAESLARDEPFAVDFWQRQPPDIRECLRDKSQSNVFQIGGAALGKRVSAFFAKERFEQISDLTRVPVEVWRALSACGLWQQLTKLKSLQVHGDVYHGRFPAGSSQWTSIESIEVNNTNVNGPFPTELCQARTLKILSLTNNEMTGGLPTEIGLLASLGKLELAHNHFTGPIPSEVGKLTTLLQVFVQSNKLSGQLPTEIGQLSLLQDFDASNNFLSGSIPTEIGCLGSLTMLRLYANELSGQIPSELGACRRLERLMLNNNQLTGIIPTSLPNAQFIGLYSNNLTGQIPSSWYTREHPRRGHLFIDMIVTVHSDNDPDEITNKVTFFA